MADADAAEAVGAACMPAAPQLVLPYAAVHPPIEADTIATLPHVAADAMEAAVAAMSVVLLPPSEQMSQSVMGGVEECLQGEIHETTTENIEVPLSSLTDNQKSCDMIGYTTERNECDQDRQSLPVVKCDADGGESLEVPSISSSIDQETYLKKLPEVTIQALGQLEEEQPAMAISDNSKESEKQIPPLPPCSSDEHEQQKPKDNGDLSDDSSNSSDHSDGEYHYDIPIYCPCKYDPYQFMHGRGRRNCGYSCSCNARRNRWNDNYPFMYGFRNLWNSMTSLRTDDHWSRWPSPEPDQRKTSLHTDDHWNHWPSPEPDQRKNRYNPGSWSWPSQEPNCEKESYTVGAGLSNPHLWTCFLNCVLQCMVHTVPLVLKLRKADHPDPCPRASIGFCCYCSLKQHVNESIRLSGSSFYPEIFINRLKSISSDFKSGAQQDAQEFLRCLLDKLDEDSIAPRSSSEESSSTEESSVVKEIFRGCLKSQLRCPECKRCSDKSEPFLDLSLDLNMVETLMDALQSFTNTELIKDFMCDGCQSHVNMEKHFKIEQAPEVLVIHLKRFTNSESKIWDKILRKYDLYGVVEHLGAYGSGHYVCYIRSSEADWYKFNDDKVYKCSVASALENTAYLIFYVKQGSSPWFSTLLEKEDKCPLDGSVSLEEGKIALVNKEEEATSSHGQGNGLTLFKKEEEAASSHGQGNGPTLPYLSEQLQRNVNDNTLSDASDKLEEGCRLGETSTGTQGTSCLIGSVDKNGHVDGCWGPSGKLKAVSPRGSLNKKEMKPSTSLEVDHAVTHGGSPGKNQNKRHLLQLSQICKDNCNSLEVDHAVTQEGSPRKNENHCHLLQLQHKGKETCCPKNISLQGGGEEGRGRGGVESKKRKSAEGGESKIPLLLHTVGGEEGRGRGGGASKKRKSAGDGESKKPLLHTGGGEEGRGRGGGESKKRKSANGGESKELRKRRKSADGGESKKPLPHTGGGEEDGGKGGGESKKQKSTDGGESKELSKRRKRKHCNLARQFALCRWRAVAGIVGKSTTRLKVTTDGELATDQQSRRI